MNSLFADIILPLGVKGLFTYSVPASLSRSVTAGVRVLVQFGPRRYYTAIVRRVHDSNPGGTLKEIVDVIDKNPFLSETNLRFFDWISEYYMCAPGEVMNAAVPAGLKAGSETFVSVNPAFTAYADLDEGKLRILTAIADRGSIAVRGIPGASQGSRIFRDISELVLAGAISADEKIRNEYRPKEEQYLVLSKHCSEAELHTLLDSLRKAGKQSALVEKYLELTGYSGGRDLVPVRKTELLSIAGALPSSLNSLLKKRVFTQVNLAESRIQPYTGQIVSLSELSAAQSEALDSIRSQMISKDTILLKGVTSSGKTEIYTHLIADQVGQGKQVLYLLPEIALTSQIIGRLSRFFGNVMAVYHSRLTDGERSEIWRRVSHAAGNEMFSVIVGVRSALLLPFSNLGLIIVDEEHDSSYKQTDPAPRYHARDAAILLASLSGGKTLLGSATPSVESYYNAMSGKYGLVNLTERFGRINLPEIVLADTREAGRRKLMVSHFTPQLLHAVDDALAGGEQVLLFRNRRGFSPWVECTECGWIPVCESCSVNMTYHKGLNRLVCHYCGSARQIPVKCGSCSSISISTIGYGTEKIEEEIGIIFPDARVARMDQDTTKSKSAFNRIITDFESGKADILVGTQMVSKGLDFENLTVVGILNADSMLNFPDFRAHERAFQMMAQVSGRAGRRQKHGKVVIQTADPRNKVIRFVVNNDYESLYRSQIEERQVFFYPPFCRLIKITVKSRDRSKLEEVSAEAGRELRIYFGKRVLGPEYPPVSKIYQWYIKNIIIKIEKQKSLAKAREAVQKVIDRLSAEKGNSAVRFAVDPDPY